MYLGLLDQLQCHLSKSEEQKNSLYEQFNTSFVIKWAKGLPE